MPTIALETLARQWQRSPKPCYWLYGDDQFRKAEAQRWLTQAALRKGFQPHYERADSRFNWGEFWQQLQTNDLFAPQQVISLWCNVVPPLEVRRQLLAWLENPSDNLLLVWAIEPVLDAKMRKGRWFNQLSQKADMVDCPGLTGVGFQQWLKRRIQHHRLTFTEAALGQLIGCLDGNTALAAQELEQLAITHANQTIEAEDLVHVMQQPHFRLFDLTDRLLANQTSAIAVLNGLQAEGIAPNLVLWALLRELRWLVQAVMDKPQWQGVWSHRKQHLQASLQRHPVHVWPALWQQAAQIDLVLKGHGAGEPWHLLRQLVMDWLNGHSQPINIFEEMML